jgi:hypothetical protein
MTTMGVGQPESRSVIDIRKAKQEEHKHVRKEEQDFRITARRNKLLGLWAAEHMNLTGEDAERYAKEVIGADLAEPGDEDVLRKVLADLAARQVKMSPAQIRAKMESLLEEATRQIAGG